MSVDARIEQLLAFLYRCPVGLAETDREGAVRHLNAAAVQLLIPHDQELSNLLELFAARDPELAELLSSAADGELVCRDRRLRLDGERVLSLTVIVVRPDCLMFAFSDAGPFLAQEERIREAADTQARLRGRLEMGARLLHDIGNVVTGLDAQAARALAEDEWPEARGVSRLKALLRAHQGALEQALGSARGPALFAYLDELERALEDRRRDSGRVLKSIELSVRHIRQILTIQRSHLRLGLIDQERYSLPELAEEALAIEGPELRRLGVALSSDYEPDLPDLPIDSTQVIRLLLNLLKNAIQAVEAAANPRIDIAVRRAAGDAGGAFVRITDNGRGFEGDPLAAADRGGGLGLDICLQIAAAHRARLELSSPGRGGGAVATVSFPAISKDRP